MKKNFNVILVLSLMFGMVSCQGTTQKAAETEENAEAPIEEAVTEPAPVVDEFHTPEFIVKTVSEWTQKAPFTASFAKTIDDVDDAALKKGSEIGWWDYDVWLESQDPDDNGSIADVEVLKVLENEADVKLNLVQYGSKSPRRLKLTFDGDKWLVADFQNSDGKWITDLCKEALEKISKW